MAVPARLLVDAGPLIALFNRRDRWHTEARAFFGEFRGTLVTTWPVLAEAGHFIGNVLTLDRHFYAYRVRGRMRFNVWSLSLEST